VDNLFHFGYLTFSSWNEITYSVRDVTV